MSRFDEYASKLPDYAERFPNLTMEREDGVLVVRLHAADGGPLEWCEPVHRQLPVAYRLIASDPENGVVIVTGTGDAFCGTVAADGWDDMGDLAMSGAAGWHKLFSEGRQLLENQLDIEVPMIAVVNGPARVHSQIALLCDIVLASEDASFSDQFHFASGVVPGDGIQTVLAHLMGPRRASYMLLTGQELGARESLDAGLVNEVLPTAEAAMARAQEIAKGLMEKPVLARRMTRLALTREIKRQVQMDLGYGLLSEGLAMHAAIAASG